MMFSFNKFHFPTTYLYVKDKDAGDTYGQGIKSFGAEGYALSPSGNKIDLS